jgi:SAM-dependent methyltransferase
MTMNPTERFGARAKDYAKHRPGYPSEAIDYILDGLCDAPQLVVADIGAGTGISSRAFAQRGLRVIAIEPNAAMRASAEADPSIEWRDGTGENTGLGDQSVDLSIIFQAFHWFASSAALDELRRVTRKRVALAQYERDESTAFGRALGDIYRAYAMDDTEAVRMRGLAFFSAFPDAAVSRRTFTWSRLLTLDDLLGLIASSSYLPKTGPEAEQLRTNIRTLYERNAADGTVTLSMQTFVVRADLRPTAIEDDRWTGKPSRR